MPQYNPNPSLDKWKEEGRLLDMNDNSQKQEDCFCLKETTLKEQIGDLRIQVRSLTLRMERMEDHEHGCDGKPVIYIKRLSGNW